MFKRSSLRDQQLCLVLEHPMEETKRLKEDKQGTKGWKRWGPYLSDRQWGTVREDYSAEGKHWEYLPHDLARSRSYRWGEDGLLGITDDECQLCFGLALWNEKDPILKERLFGLSPNEGNHGEDVKECYYYLDSTPTHSYMKALYKYPQNEYPYSWLVEENKRRARDEPEFELLDTGIFDNNRYWDIDIEYAKNTPNDILISIMVTNRGPDTSKIHVLPTLWYRNTWIWGCRHDGWTGKPGIVETSPGSAECFHEGFGRFMFVNDVGPDGSFPEMLFTDNETNTWVRIESIRYGDVVFHNQRLYNGSPNYTPYVKDAFNRYVVNGEHSAVNPLKRGTKMASHYVLELPPGGHHFLRCRLMAEDEITSSPFAERSFGSVLNKRRKEANEFYKIVIPDSLSPEERTVCRQAYAGLLWNKMFYNYIVKDWLDGDEDMPTPPYSRHQGRNSDPDWSTFHARDVVCVPDKWEYASFSSSDVAFHVLPMARIDPEFAKKQLMLFLRECYMAPNGQILGRESHFDEVQPPVLAYVCHRVYKMTERKGQRDTVFLAKCFQKLLINFTWWANRKDAFGTSIFGGGIIGKTIMKGTFTCETAENKDQGQQSIVQADGTAWMAFYCAVMLGISLDLAVHDNSYEDMASKFLEHFTQIADVMNNLSGSLWNEEGGFYYDHIQITRNSRTTLWTRSISGLVPLLCCIVIEDDHIEKLSSFRLRLEWLKNKADLATKISLMDPTSESQCHRLLAFFTRQRLARVLKFMLDDKEFLSPFGIRSLSRDHLESPVEVKCVCAKGEVKENNKVLYETCYIPGETEANTNEQGPVWLGMNYLIIDALERYDSFYGSTFKVDFPSYSGNRLRLRDVALEMSRRLVSLFLPNDQGRRPCHGNSEKYTYDVYWNQLLQFYEYFNADSGLGYGANHNTGNSGLVCKLLDKLGSSR